MASPDDGLDTVRMMCQLQRMSDEFHVRTVSGNPPSKEELFEYHSMKVSACEQARDEYPNEPEFAEALAEANEQLDALRNEA